MSAAAATPKKKASKPKKPADHPKYSEMVKKAIEGLKERGGSSRQAILKYILANFKVGDAAAANRHLKMALRAGVNGGKLKQSKGTGASGSFRLDDKAKAAKKTKKAAKPKAKKPKAAKKPAGEKKPKAKKTKTPKKKAAAPKVKKSPAKKAAKPKKSPAKKAAKKTKSPKKAAKK